MPDQPHPDLAEASVAGLAADMAAGRRSARSLAEGYLARIAAMNEAGPCLRAVIETNPDALAEADALDRERQATGPRGVLHGVPVLVKDNVATATPMQATAGSLALLGARHTEAGVARRLREAGAVILASANMSEWANFRSTRSSWGWSGRGGQARNAHRLDRTPSGSSSGSGSGAAAGLAAVAVGTETDGSILAPAAANGVVGIKPTVGLTSRAGVIPIAHSQDTVGPIARTVADAAALLGALAGPDPDDPMSEGVARFVQPDYTAFLDADGLRGARLGVPRQVYWGYSPPADAVAETALGTLRGCGAVLVDPADIPTAALMARGWPPQDSAALTVLLYEFKHDLNAHLGRLDGTAPRTLAELIAFNEANAAAEMPWFGQELFHMAEAMGPLTDTAYSDALARNHQLSRQEGIDAVLDANHLDALVMPTGNPATMIDPVNGSHGLGSSSRPAALAGYPAITVPAGMVAGCPVGLTFMGRAGSEPVLIRLAHAFEQAAGAWRAPRYLNGPVELGD